jgi:acyl carrier protein
MSAVPSIQMPDVRTESAEEVLQAVKSVLIDVIGEDYLLDIPITMDTAFEADLELESVEFVALAERLQERYAHINFVDWVADMQVEELMTLRIGQLVEFITQCRS